MTGPQGSGNHLFSKVLALNPEIQGWKDLLDTYWIGHDEEPLSKFWNNPVALAEFDWSSSQVFLTSISCPYIDNGEVAVPNYKDFITEAEKYAEVKVLVIGRDQNILNYQQTRVRGNPTAHIFKENLKNLLSSNVLFISQELLYLYRLDYLNYIEDYLCLQRTTSSDRLESIIETDANAKYIQPVETHWLDEEVKLASQKRT
jgi:hypothetical protein